MLVGTKPLAMFYDDADAPPSQKIIPEKQFDKFVEREEFGKAERTFELAYDPRIGRNRRVRYVLYCLRGEEWRLEAMFLALRTRMAMGKSDEGIERIIGALLGYSNDDVGRHVAAAHAPK